MNTLETSDQETITLYDGNEVDADASVVELHDGEFALEDDGNLITLYDGKTYAVSGRDKIVELYDGEWALHDDGDLVELHCGSYGILGHQDIVSLDDGRYAMSEECRTCAGTDELCLVDEMSRWLGSWYSDEYLNEETFTCDSCGERYHNDDYGADGLCQSCSDAEDETEDDDGLASYSCKSADYMQPEGKGPLYFGIELEVEAREGRHLYDEVENAYRSLGRSYVLCKRDGSLSDERGFEIVTRPDSVEVHKRKWHSFIESASERLSSWSNGRCGMHIHATRSALSQLQLGKMLVLVNHPNNSRLVKVVAGRSLKDWACIEHGKKLVDGKKLSPARYVALNVTDRTVEMRIFKGTLKPSSFWKNLEFYAAVIAFCAPAEHSTADVDRPQPFLRFVSQHRKTYPNLHAFLVHRHLYADHGVTA